MEYILLYKVGIVIDGFIKGGYILAGSYFIRIAVNYVQDYRISIAKEKGEI